MENEGGAGTANAHWERRIFFNEIMTGSDMSGDFIFSMFTFKLLEDSGWYRL
jgi:leishmanolysin